ncbi:hypothetical protein AB0K14_10930 [Actinosynnema sp. NPDC050801]
MRIVPAALVAVAAAALLALGAGSAAAEQATPDHAVAVAGSSILVDNRDM